MKTYVVKLVVYADDPKDAVVKTVRPGSIGTAFVHEQRNPSDVAEVDVPGSFEYRQQLLREVLDVLEKTGVENLGGDGDATYLRVKREVT